MAKHNIALVPGLFGFAKLGGFDYFMHIEEALERRFVEAGLQCDFTLVSSPPTASIVRRAEVLFESMLASCARTKGPIHLIGHSTGGLDVRLFASPTAIPHLPQLGDRIRTAVSVSTPHYGTPLAHELATLPGRRLLLALSVLTFGTLRGDGLPKKALSPLLGSLGKIDEALGKDVKVLERTSELLMSIVDEEGATEVREWFAGIRADRGAVIQLTPESMDIFNAAVGDNPDIRYGCIVTRMPPPGPIRVARGVMTPVGALSAALFTTLYVGASQASTVYPSPIPDPSTLAYLEERLGGRIQPSFNDGLVPTLSQLWGEILWAGTADHLDILGHFDGEKETDHTDWQVSGAGFTEEDFEDAMDALADFLIDSVEG